MNIQEIIKKIDKLLSESENTEKVFASPRYWQGEINAYKNVLQLLSERKK